MHYLFITLTLTSLLIGSVISKKIIHIVTLSFVGTVYRKLCHGILGQQEKTFLSSVGFNMPSLSLSYFSNNCVKNC